MVAEWYELEYEKLVPESERAEKFPSFNLRDAEMPKLGGFDPDREGVEQEWQEHGHTELMAHVTGTHRAPVPPRY